MKQREDRVDYVEGAPIERPGRVTARRPRLRRVTVRAGATQERNADATTERDQETHEAGRREGTRKHART